MIVEPQTATERVAYVVWLLAHGQKLTAAQVSSEVGVTERRARKMMDDISHVCPVYRNDDGEWVWMMVDALRKW